ncbi:hypothetical protein ALT717_190050 [Alteromonas macleodii]
MPPRLELQGHDLKNGNEFKEVNDVVGVASSSRKCRDWLRQL